MSDWPYDETETPIAEPNAPDWECPEGICECNHPDETGEKYEFSVMLFSPEGERMDGARCRNRVLAATAMNMIRGRPGPSVIEVGTPFGGTQPATERPAGLIGDACAHFAVTVSIIQAVFYAVRAAIEIESRRTRVRTPGPAQRARASIGKLARCAAVASVRPHVAEPHLAALRRTPIRPSIAPTSSALRVDTAK